MPRPSCTACHGKGTGQTPPGDCHACGDLTAQARDWILTKCPPSISGQGGHGAAFRAACVLVKGFDLTPAAAEGIFAEWNHLCSPPWNPAECSHKLRSADSAPDPEPRGYLIWKSSTSHSAPRRAAPPADPAPEPPKKRQPFDLAALRRAQLPGLFVDEAWLASRSPIPLTGITTSRFLAHLYQPGERVITFTSQFSDGNYGARIGPYGTVTWAQLHAWKSGTTTEISPPFDDPARLRDPRTTITPEGAWFLAQPVDGKWHLNPDSIDRHTGLPKYSRRSRHSVTAWRYLVLESDDAPTHLWLNLLVQLHLPIAALYTSGGRSIHALVRIDAPSKAHFDDARDSLMPLLSTLGADPAAMTAVRLTRLPGAYRCGKTVRENINGRPVKRFHPFPQPLLQRLLYLNPTPNATPIITQPQHRHPAPVA